MALKTICSECCFFDKNKDDDGIICHHNLFHILNERNTTITIDDTQCVIDRICPYYRKLDWESNLNIDEKKKLCQQSVYIMGSIILLTKDEHDLKNALEILHSYQHIDRFEILVICTGKTQPVINFIKEMNLEYECIKLINPTNESIRLAIYQQSAKLKNGFLFILECDKDIDNDILDKVNYIVNKQLFRLLHIPPTTGLHQSVSMTHLYKYLKGDLQEDYENKITAIANEENLPTPILSWKEINEYYNSSL